MSSAFDHDTQPIIVQPDSARMDAQVSTPLEVRSSRPHGPSPYFRIHAGTPLDAILAAFAEQLSVEHHIERPRWTRAIGPLAEEWSPPLTPTMHARAAAATPEPFRRRKLVLAKSALFRQAA